MAQRRRRARLITVLAVLGALAGALVGDVLGTVAAVHRLQSAGVLDADGQ